MRAKNYLRDLQKIFCAKRRKDASTVFKAFDLAEELFGTVEVGASNGTGTTNNDCAKVLKAEWVAAWGDTNAAKARVKRLIVLSVMTKLWYKIVSAEMSEVLAQKVKLLALEVKLRNDEFTKSCNEMVSSNKSALAERDETACRYHQRTALVRGPVKAHRNE